MNYVQDILKKHANTAFNGGIYIAPDIPDKKMNNAISRYGGDMLANSVVMLLDNTFFGSAKTGMLFSGTKMIWKNDFAEAIEIEYTDIESAEYVREEEIIEKDDGTTRTKILKYVNITLKNEEIIKISSVSSVNYEKFADLINEISQSEVEYFESNQIFALEEMSIELKLAYIKIMANLVMEDVDFADGKGYAEFLSLVSRLNFLPEERAIIRNYVYNANNHLNNKEVMDIIFEFTPKGNEKAIIFSLIKDIVYIYRKIQQKTAAVESDEIDNEHVEEAYNTDDAEVVKESDKDAFSGFFKDSFNEFDEDEDHAEDESNAATELIEIDLVSKYPIIADNNDIFNANNELISLAEEIIEKEEKLLSGEISTKEFESSIKDFAIKTASVGVPVAAIYMSGSIMGLGIQGVLYGLSSIAGIFGFASIFSGLGVVVLLGLGTYTGLRALTGGGGRENQRSREILLQGVIQTTQKTINIILEDLNYISDELGQALEQSDHQTLQIEKLKQMMTMLASTGTNLNNKATEMDIHFYLNRCPNPLNHSKLKNLTEEPTKAKFYDSAMAYYEEIEEAIDEENVRTEYWLREDLNVRELEDLSNIISAIGYDDIQGDVKNIQKKVGRAASSTKRFIKGLME